MQKSIKNQLHKLNQRPNRLLINNVIEKQKTERNKNCPTNLFLFSIADFARWQERNDKKNEKEKECKNW